MSVLNSVFRFVGAALFLAGTAAQSVNAENLSSGETQPDNESMASITMPREVWGQFRSDFEDHVRSGVTNAWTLNAVVDGQSIPINAQDFDQAAELLMQTMYQRSKDKGTAVHAEFTINGRSAECSAQPWKRGPVFEVKCNYKPKF